MAIPMNDETLLGELGNSLSGGKNSDYLLQGHYIKSHEFYLWMKLLVI